MVRINLLLLAFIFALPTWALDSTFSFYMSQGGSNSNACGYGPNHGGTNYALSTTPYMGINTNVGTHPNISATINGSVSTYTIYEIASVTSTTWILDRGGIVVTFSGYTPIASDAGNGVLFLNGTLSHPVAIVGGSCASIQGMFNIAANGAYRFYVAYSPTPYPVSASIVQPAGCVFYQQGNVATIVSGYYATPDDMPAPGSGHQPIIQSTAAVDLFNLAGNCGITLEYLHLSGNNGLGTCGVQSFNTANGCSNTNGGSGVSLIGLEIEGFKSYGAQIAGHNLSPMVLDSWIHNNCQGSFPNSSGYALQDYGLVAQGNVINNNNCYGIEAYIQVDYGFLDHNIIYSNGNYGIYSYGHLVATNNTVNGNGNANLYNFNHEQWIFESLLANNIFSSSTGYGLNDLPPYLPAIHNNTADLWMVHPNAFYNNALGPSVYATGAGDVLPGSTPYQGDTQTPPNFMLNYTSAGMSLQNAGMLGAGLPQNGYVDMGAYQAPRITGGH